MPRRQKTPFKINYKRTMFLLKEKTMFFAISGSKELKKVEATKKVRGISFFKFRSNFVEKLIQLENI